LGSITHIATSSGSVVQELSYDAWGRLRNPVNQLAYTPDSEPALLLGRGYTGHEHLPWFGLINMNARLYDPALGRFLSPDPFVQAPDFSQSFNRYSYCLNNPLKYTDPDGEIFGTILTFFVDLFDTMFFKGGLDFTSSSSRDKAWKAFDPTASWSKTNHAWKIDMGLFQTDSKMDFKGRVWQLFSRFTWELPQTLVGNTYTHIRNIGGNVDRVDYLGGATFATNEYSKRHNGITFGSYINMNIREEITGDFDAYATTVDPMYMHEYGHTLDSKRWGWFYLPVIATYSGISALFSKKLLDAPWDTHSGNWSEVRANKRAKKYFEKYYGVDWSAQHPSGKWKWIYDNKGMPLYIYYYTIEDYYPTN
jgi:RHS repeat-associated protein